MRRWLTLAAALAVRDACAAMVLPCAAGPPALKWPNDLLAADDPAKKVGGILVETRTQHGIVDEAARVTGGQRPDADPRAAGLDPRAAERGRPMRRRMADGRPIRGTEADVVPGEDPVRRASRKPKSMVPPRLKRKLR